MGAPDLLQHLRRAGLDLSLTPDGRLRVAPRSALTDDHRAAILAGRDGLILALQAESTQPAAEPSTASQYEIHFRNADPIVMTFAPAIPLAEVFRRYPGALAAVEAGSTIPACRLCRHASRFGNCAIPVEAGLAERFCLVAHPDDGHDCGVFVSVCVADDG